MKKFYSITYDLMKPNQNYAGLTSKLESLGAVKVEYSQWLLKTSVLDAVAIRDTLQPFIDSNDRLLVAGLTGEAAWHNLLVPVDKIKQTLAA